MHLRSEYPGKFIFSYQDNSVSNDLPLSKKMQIDMHRMLLSILKKYGDVVLFLKPKRERLLNIALKAVPELQDYIHRGRIRIFFGETPGTRAVPAEIGIASDLVVGLCLSTVAAECFFAGTVAFHADLIGFVNNGFSNRGLGKVVFRDVASLEKAITKRIVGEDRLSYDDYREYYYGLDPFQDEKTSQRVGFLMKKMQEGLEQGSSRSEIVSRIKKEYDTYLSPRHLNPGHLIHK